MSLIFLIIKNMYSYHCNLKYPYTDFISPASTSIYSSPIYRAGFRSTGFIELYSTEILEPILLVHVLLARIIRSIQ